VEVEGVEWVFFEVVGEIGELTVVIDGVHWVWDYKDHFE
jgi:hypothetical protein